MSLDDAIRTRAHQIFTADVDRTRVRELDDWLQAEAEIIVADLAGAVAEPSYSQNQVWYDSEQIASLFTLLSKRLQGRRTGSVLMARIASFQDYLTSSWDVSDQEAVRQGTSACHIYVLVRALRTLLGDAFLTAREHSMFKELKDLFSVDPIAYETTRHNISSAATLGLSSGATVEFIEEGEWLSPDLCVNGIAYVECKDLHPASRAGLAQGLADQLAKATKQLNAAQLRLRLPGTGVCVDVPWGSLPLSAAEWQSITEAISAADGPDFIFITCSGATHTARVLSYPSARCLVTKARVPQQLTSMLERLAPMSYALAPGGFDQILHPVVTRAPAPGADPAVTRVAR